MFERTSPGISEKFMFSSSPDLEERSGGKPSKSKANDIHDKYERWVKGTGQVGTDADRNASRGIDRVIGRRTLPTGTPPPVIVYVNPTPRPENDPNPILLEK